MSCPTKARRTPTVRSLALFAAACVASAPGRWAWAVPGGVRRFGLPGRRAALQTDPRGTILLGLVAGRHGPSPAVAVVARHAAKKKKANAPICDGDTVYIKVMTGRYIGEIDGTSKKEWVKARGTKKDDLHALTIEKRGGGEVESGDQVKLVMPLAQTNGTKVHMDVVGSAVRARYYDPRGEWQKMTIIKQEGGVIYDGDTIFLRSVFMNGRDYLDCNPLEKSPDGEVKCRWPDEGQWQKMTIEK